MKRQFLKPIASGNRNHGHVRDGSTPSRTRGISLIEVMVSVLVMGVGLLGIAAMQSLALRSGQSSLESTQAVMQTTAIIEAMRANRLDASSYNTAGPMCAPKGGTTLAGNDLDSWVASLKNTIGDAATTCGEISKCPDDCVITVQWDDSRAGADAGGASRKLVTRARI